jgi:hypothetical protein
MMIISWRIYDRHCTFSTLPAAILLGHLKMPFAKIKEAVLSCDESVLSEQHLRQMESFAPDDKEVQNYDL